jgi:hypothetical protein
VCHASPSPTPGAGDASMVVAADMAVHALAPWTALPSLARQDEISAADRSAAEISAAAGQEISGAAGVGNVGEALGVRRLEARVWLLLAAQRYFLFEKNDADFLFFVSLNFILPVA